MNEQKNPIFVHRESGVPTAEYKEWIADLKLRYRKSQVKAAIKVNGEMLQFYWTLGRDILAMKADSKWGTGFLKRLSLDLQQEFQGHSGLSYSNLKYARQWYLFYHERITNRQQLVGNLGYLKD